jgi:peptidoglycan hydrolase-like protein with peptidoglycan-binding domain
MKGDKAKGDKAAGGNRDQVKAVQQALKDKGHDPGSIDGMMGPKTRQALKDFQKAQGLSDTGRLDAETRAKLGVAASSSMSSPSGSSSASPRTESGSSTSGSSSSGASSPGSSSPGASQATPPAGSGSTPKQ